MWTLNFWRDAAERALRTFAQSLIATLAIGTSILDWAWTDALGIGAGATLLSLLTSIAASGRGDVASASLLAPAGGRHEA